MAVLATIRMKLDEMTPMQQDVARFVLGQPEDVINMSITQFAEATGVKSESSIVRFYRTLGFSGYHDFKVSLATEIAGNAFYHSYSDITEEDTIDTVQEKIFHGAMQALHDNLHLIQADTLLKAVELFETANRIIVLGYAVSGSIASDVFFKFSRLGLNCHFSRDSHINAILLTDPQEGDVIFAISHSGESKDVVIPTERAKPAAKIVALTGSSKSPLSKIADVCITTVTEEMNYRTETMLSRLVQLAVVDTLYTTMGLRQGVPAWERLSKSRQTLSYLKY